ncbi:unnamed protein product [Rodentolepis nana]|uniref:Mitochondrial coenzyme A transporter SLC25A42 n=1 Tax=Rodentolepis nana TaxID=102285 RepID=A0A0R3TM36_RODNA|nr:unnamed protein product [Rodentolepis nana]
MKATEPALKDSSKTEYDRKGLTALNFVIGGLAGCCAKSVIAPLDRAKINFQASEMCFNVKTLLHFFKKSYRTAGITSFWRGNSATLTRIFPYSACQYGVHEKAKQFLGLTDISNNSLSITQVRSRRFIAGCTAGSVSVALTYPLDLVRARMAITERVRYANLFDIARMTYREEGLLSLYRGFTPALIGILPYSGIAFSTFETLKEWRLKRRISPDGRSPQRLRPIENLFCGAFAGVLGQTASYPLDIVRRRMQTAGHPEYTRSIVGTMRIVYQHEGLFHGLFKGVTMNWIKGPIAGAISFTVFHQLQSLYSRWQNCSKPPPIS